MLTSGSRSLPKKLVSRLMGVTIGSRTFAKHMCSIGVEPHQLCADGWAIGM